MKNFFVPIIVGHSELSQGMRCFNSLSEFHYNQNIAIHLKKKLEQFIDCDIFYRTDKLRYPNNIQDLAERIKSASLSRMGELGSLPKILTIELHLNAFNKKDVILGSEVLCLGGKENERFAKIITNNLEKYFVISSRNKEGFKQVFPQDRGYQNLKKVAWESRSIAGVLVEPCFCDTQNRESWQLISEPMRYVDCLFDAILQYVRSYE